MSVTNGKESSTLVLKSGSTTLSSHDITFTGFVTLTGLSGGTTTINGACIKTGTISADRIDVDRLKVKEVYNSTGSYTALSTVGSSLYIGGTSWQPDSVYVYGTSSVYIGGYKGSGVSFNPRSQTVVFGSSTYRWSLGSSTVPLNHIYVDALTAAQLTLTKDAAQLATSSGKIGFFGVSPNTRKSISASTNNQGYTTANANNYLYILNNLVGALKNYGLITA